MGANFPKTRWTLIKDVSASSASERWKEFFEAYYNPVLFFIRGRGFRREQAEDLAQDVFVQIAREGTLQRASADKGLFRTYVLAITKNVIRHHVRAAKTKKRGVRVVYSSDAQSDSESTGIFENVARDEQQEFDRLWARNVMIVAIKQIEVQWKPGRPKFHVVLKMFFIDGKNYAEIQAKLGANKSTVANWLNHGKKVLQRYVKVLISKYESGASSLTRELRVFGALTGTVRR